MPSASKRRGRRMTSGGAPAVMTAARVAIAAVTAAKRPKECPIVEV